jgi:hypothetical protein
MANGNRIPLDENRRTLAAGVSSADGVTILPLEVDPNTGELLTTATGGGGGGTQYTDGNAAPAHPIGTIPVFNNAGTITAVSDTNPLPVDASVTVTGVATAVNQTNASQKTQVVDGSGNVIGATSNALDINIKSGNPTTIAATQSGTWNITNISGTVSLPTGAATAALQTQPGVDIGDVTVNNASGASAVNIQDGGNSITVDGTVAATQSGTWTVQPGNTANTTAWKVDGSAVTQPISGSVTVTQGTGSNLHAVVDSGTITTVTTLTGTTTLTPGTGATNLGKAEDAGHTTGDVGVFALGVRNDTLADVTSTTADYSQLATDLKGRVVTTGAPRALKVTQQTTITSSTSETTVLTAVTSTFLDVYGVIVTNTSATVTKVTFKDATAGTTRFVIEVPATETRGFMLPLDAAHVQAATNNNWTATCGTSVASVEITMLAVKMV